MWVILMAIVGILSAIPILRHEDSAVSGKEKMKDIVLLISCSFSVSWVVARILNLV